MATTAETKNSRLFSGQYLGVGEYLTSPNGAFFATLLKSGHLCVYAGPAPRWNRHNVWNSDRWGDDGNYVAMMQDDGNLAVYPGTNVEDRKSPPVWHAGVSQPKGTYHLHLTNKGQLAIVKSTLQKAIDPEDYEEVLWQSDRTEEPGPDYAPDQRCWAPEGQGRWLGGGLFWQTFVPAWTGMLSRLELYVSTSGADIPSETVVVSIFEGLPEQGRRVGGREITVQAKPAEQMKDYSAEFCHVTAGRTYTLQLESKDPQKRNSPSYVLTNTFNYPVGSSSVFGAALMFSTYVRPDRPDWPHQVG